MFLFDLILIAIGLSMDACAVSIAAGSSGRAGTQRAAFRIPFHFGLFQFMMPIVGWLLGKTLQAQITAIDHWTAFLLLSWVGFRMVRASYDPDPMSRYKGDPSRGFTLVFLSVATSVDALVVGFSLALLKVNIIHASLLIGLVTGLLSSVGLRTGKRLGFKYGAPVERLGGLLLIGMGIRILWAHTMLS